jgi:hypothetical protein
VPVAEEDNYTDPARDADEDNDEQGRNHDSRTFLDIEPESFDIAEAMREFLRIFQGPQRQEPNYPVLR